MIVIPRPMSKLLQRRVIAGVLIKGGFLPMSSVQPLYHAVGLRMRDPGLDVGDAAALYERTPFGADKLAAVIVDELWQPGRLDRLRDQPLQRFLDGESDGLCEHGRVQAPMNQEPAVAIDDIDQIVPPL